MSIHRYPTRQSNEFHLPLTRTIFTKSVFTFTGPKLWNNLNSTTKDAPSLYSFKKRLKTFLLASYQESS